MTCFIWKGSIGFRQEKGLRTWVAENCKDTWTHTQRRLGISLACILECTAFFPSLRQIAIKILNGRMCTQRIELSGGRQLLLKWAFSHNKLSANIFMAHLLNVINSTAFKCLKKSKKGWGLSWPCLYLTWLMHFVSSHVWHNSQYQVSGTFGPLDVLDFISQKWQPGWPIARGYKHCSPKHLESQMVLTSVLSSR